MSYSIRDLEGDDAAAAARFHARRKVIARTQELIAEGRGLIAETPKRRKAHHKRSMELSGNTSMRMGAPIGGLDDGVEERIIGKSYDIVSTEFFEAGMLAQKAVGRINGPLGKGTGFLVGEDLVMTNHHVLPMDAEAGDATIDMDAEFDLIQPSPRTKQYHLDPGRFFLTDAARDITIVAVTDFVGDKPPLKNFGWHVLLADQGKIRVGDPVNIIQHPDGKDKSVTVHNSHFLHLSDEDADAQYCWYTGDTEGGSSGSPVFNNMWEVVAVHHRAIRRMDDKGNILGRSGKPMSAQEARNNPEEIDYIANQGVRASHVVKAVEEAALSTQMSEIRDALLALWSKPGAQARAKAAIDRTTMFA